MSETIRGLLAGARQARNARRLDEAMRDYHRAAELARQDLEFPLLAHALRHLSDLAREMGRPEEALAAGRQAVDLVRGIEHAAPLDVANALRVTALACQCLGNRADALPLWREARELYARVDVTDGVQECDENLAGFSGPAPVPMPTQEPGPAPGPPKKK